jgi:hypothetical protein
MFLRNAWYIAAWSEDVTGKPLARMLLGESIVLFRTAAGVTAALVLRRRSNRRVDVGSSATGPLFPLLPSKSRQIRSFLPLDKYGRGRVLEFGIVRALRHICLRY